MEIEAPFNLTRVALETDNGNIKEKHKQIFLLTHGNQSCILHYACEPYNEKLEQISILTHWKLKLHLI